MQLRAHPLTIRKSGYVSWPPQWTALDPEQDDKPAGELGGLEDVDMHALIRNKIFLFIRWEGYRYVGVMAFDDTTFCRQVFTLLVENIGRSIKEIGDLDLSHTL